MMTFERTGERRCVVPLQHPPLQHLGNQCRLQAALQEIRVQAADHSASHRRQMVSSGPGRLFNAARCQISLVCRAVCWDIGQQLNSVLVAVHPQDRQIKQVKELHPLQNTSGAHATECNVAVRIYDAAKHQSARLHCQRATSATAGPRNVLVLLRDSQVMLGCPLAQLFVPGQAVVKRLGGPRQFPGRWVTSPRQVGVR
ncbi:hypothetical protein [Deinococcus multiflagellatus]|uniref:hypothetical protein n=1 Tax=Deinococcus multiflagellatus TaxID=1656887 RepID=UPI001CC9DCFC|nr:hypothetical protein [Deinococcus multiflagellatus]MBZ9714893.1 hypothetical protein [Deinococcus multiflagellatus]